MVGLSLFFLAVLRKIMVMYNVCVVEKGEDEIKSCTEDDCFVVATFAFYNL